MTGFGSGSAPLGRAVLTVDARSVNSRFFDGRVRLPLELSEHTATVEELARSMLTRGRVEIVGRVEGNNDQPVTLARDRAVSAFKEITLLRDSLCPTEPVPLSLLSLVPNLFVSETALGAQDSRTAVVQAATLACQGLCAMRAREGAALAADLQNRVDLVSQLVTGVQKRGPLVVESQRSRLKERLARLMVGLDVQLDPGRVEQEIVMFADRTDVSEELTRLESHLGQLRDLLSSKTDAVGRRLDFLLQEMAREANTIGSKSADAEIAQSIAHLRAELERMREQVQNIL